MGINVNSSPAEGSRDRIRFVAGNGARPQKRAIPHKNKDGFFHVEKKTPDSSFKIRVQKLSHEFQKSKRNQGFISRFWDFMKGTFGVSKKNKSAWNPLYWIGFVINYDTSSKAISQSFDNLQGKELEDLNKAVEAGNKEEVAKIFKRATGIEITEKELTDAVSLEELVVKKLSGKVDDYKESQKLATDIIADIASGVASFVAYSVAFAAFIAAPITGGSSLMAVPLALGASTLTGGLTKVAIKELDRAGSDEDRGSFLYNFCTGSVMGLLAPVTACAGAGAGGFIARRLGLGVVNETVGNLGKGLVTNVVFKGGFGKRFFARFMQMAVDGAISGGPDNVIRHWFQTGSLKGTGSALVQGTVGGLILSPVIGGSLRGAGAAASKSIGRTADTINLARADMATPPPNVSTNPLADKLKASLMMLALFGQEPELALLRGMQFETAQTFISSVDNYFPKIQKVMSSPEFIAATGDRRAAMLIEISPSAGKMAQIFASDDSLMPAMKRVCEMLKSKGTPTRNVQQAQAYADVLFGAGEYEVKKLLGVGTIAETFAVVSKKDNSELVIKMVKEGVTPELIESERLMAKSIVKDLYSDPLEVEFNLKKVDHLYDGWIEELDFRFEYEGAVNMSKGARRFSVAEPVELGYHPSDPSRACGIVCKKARGIQMDTLLEMLAMYKTDPIGCFTKFQDLILTFPQLRTPLESLKGLPKKYLQVMNEQSLFVSWGKKTIHGDPHSGNIFVHFDNGKINLEYIDTGLTAKMTSKHVLEQLGMATDMLLGNSKGIAKRIVNNAVELPSGKTKKEIVDALAKRLDDRLFKAGINLRDSSYLSRTIIESIDAEHIVQSRDHLLVFKSLFQGVSNYKEMSKLLGVKSSNVLRDSLGDVAYGAAKAFLLHPVLAVRNFASSVLHTVTNPFQALRTIYQFLSRYKPEAHHISPAA